MSLTRNGFQSFVTQQLPPAQPGDFASMNPRSVALTAIAGGLPGTPGFRVAASQSVTVGYFAWGAPATGLTYSSAAGAGAGAVIGFIAQEQQTVITAFLGQDRMTIEAGFPVTLFTRGDFWANVAGLPVVAGAAIFAVNTTGQPSTVDDSTTDPTGYVAATSAIADVTTATSTIAADTGVLTTGGAASANNIQVGMTVTGTGIPANTFILAQLSGTAGAGSGATYQTNYQGPAVASATFTYSQGNLVKITPAP
jgi:hypothetical protein